MLQATLPRRLVLLGASNLTLGLGTILETARRLWGGPFEVLAALGNGRSYGMRRYVLWRALPGIVTSGLWSTLEYRAAVPAVALITDIGNDLPHDILPAQILAWVETCVERLQRVGALVVMTPLPMCSLRRLSRARYVLLRSLLFPRSQLSYKTAQARAEELDQGLRTLARRRELHLAEHRAAWYGLDPIHIRRRNRSEAWLEILSRGCGDNGLGALPRRSWQEWLALHRLQPERRWVLGWERRQVQPTAELSDGTKLALY